MLSWLLCASIGNGEGTSISAHLYILQALASLTHLYVYESTGEKTKIGQERKKVPTAKTRSVV